MGLKNVGIIGMLASLLTGCAVSEKKVEKPLEYEETLSVKKATTRPSATQPTTQPRLSVEETWDKIRGGFYGVKKNPCNWFVKEYGLRDRKDISDAEIKRAEYGVMVVVPHGDYEESEKQRLYTLGKLDERLKKELLKSFPYFDLNRILLCYKKLGEGEKFRELDLSRGLQVLFFSRKKVEAGEVYKKIKSIDWSVPLHGEGGLERYADSWYDWIVSEIKNETDEGLAKRKRFYGKSWPQSEVFPNAREFWRRRNKERELDYISSQPTTRPTTQPEKYKQKVIKKEEK